VKYFTVKNIPQIFFPSVGTYELTRDKMSQWSSWASERETVALKKIILNRQPLVG